MILRKHKVRLLTIANWVLLACSYFVEYFTSKHRICPPVAVFGSQLNTFWIRTTFSLIIIYTCTRHWKSGFSPMQPFICISKCFWAYTRYKCYTNNFRHLSFMLASIVIIVASLLQFRLAGSHTTWQH